MNGLPDEFAEFLTSVLKSNRVSTEGRVVVKRREQKETPSGLAGGFFYSIANRLKR
jgi:hypothetical protein